MMLLDTRVQRYKDNWVYTSIVVEQQHQQDEEEEEEVEEAKA